MRVQAQLAEDWALVLPSPHQQHCRLVRCAACNPSQMKTAALTSTNEHLSSICRAQGRAAALSAPSPEATGCWVGCSKVWSWIGKWHRISNTCSQKWPDPA